MTYDYIEVKKVKGTKKCTIKRKLKFMHYKKCKRVTQLKNKINKNNKNNLNKNNIDKNNLTQHYQKFVDKSKQILQLQETKYF